MELGDFWLNLVIFSFTIKIFLSILLVMVLKGVFMNGNNNRMKEVERLKLIKELEEKKKEGVGGSNTGYISGI